MNALNERIAVAKLRREATLRKFTKDDWRAIGGTRPDLIQKQIIKACTEYFEAMRTAIESLRPEFQFGAS
jgi:hypothetical protein